MSIKVFSAEELVELGNNIVKKVRSALFLGSSNLQEDILKTGGWVHVLLNSQRKRMKWKKGAKRWEIEDSIRGYAPNREDSSVDSLGEHALYGARAFMSKSGNCGEMVDTSLYFLSVFFKNQDLEKEGIKISSVEFPDPYDHTLIKITMKRGGSDQTIYIDPWMGIAYLEKDYEQNIRLTIDKLTQEIKQQSAELSVDILAEMHNQENMEKITKPASLLPVESIDSSDDCEYYIRIFETECQTESRYTHEASEHFSNELMGAIKNRDFKLISTCLERGARVDGQVLGMSFLPENIAIRDKIHSHFLKSHDLKLLYFKRLLRSLKNVAGVDARIDRVQQVKNQIKRYKMNLEENRDNLLKGIKGKHAVQVNDFFDRLIKNGLRDIENDCEQYIREQENIRTSSDKITKPLETIVSVYQNRLNNRPKEGKKWKKIGSFLRFSGIPTDTLVGGQEMDFQMNFLKEMKKQIMLSMQDPMPERRLSEADANQAVLGVLFILKMQLKEKEQKGILGGNGLREKIDEELLALLPPHSNLNKPDPKAVNLCMQQMNKFTEEQINAIGSVGYWNKLYIATKRLNFIHLLDDLKIWERLNKDHAIIININLDIPKKLLKNFKEMLRREYGLDVNPIKYAGSNVSQLYLTISDHKKYKELLRNQKNFSKWEPSPKLRS